MAHENVAFHLQGRRKGGGSSLSEIVTLLQQTVASPNCMHEVSSGSMSDISISVANSDPEVWSSSKYNATLSTVPLDLTSGS
jgi:hypothetical protein